MGPEIFRRIYRAAVRPGQLWPRRSGQQEAGPWGNSPPVRPAFYEAKKQGRKNKPPAYRAGLMDPLWPGGCGPGKIGGYIAWNMGLL